LKGQQGQQGQQVLLSLLRLRLGLMLADILDLWAHHLGLWPAQVLDLHLLSQMWAHQLGLWLVQLLVLCLAILLLLWPVPQLIQWLLNAWRCCTDG
jgi:hypothetical protein